uniref:Uncharacterized protein n=1 Tax=Sphaerodactylus townsendi TaxID=933632 RepID=A0ACB8FUK7_9SAUR
MLNKAMALFFFSNADLNIEDPTFKSISGHEINENTPAYGKSHQSCCTTHFLLWASFLSLKELANNMRMTKEALLMLFLNPTARGEDLQETRAMNFSIIET